MCGWLTSRCLFAVAAVGVLCSAFACAKQEAPRNLVVVVVDTLRVSRLHLYGAERETSPALDRLARDSAVFERAYSAAPWTKPSVASLLTGRYPRRHTLVRMGSKLPETAETLAEHLRADGFATAAVVSHSLIARGYGFDQGFERFADLSRGYRETSSPEVTEQALAWLDELTSGSAPWFLFVHYFDPHYDYVRHPEIGFAPAAAGRLQGGEPIGKLLGMNLERDEIGLLVGVYDEEIRFTDDAIGELLEGLRARGAMSDTVVVVTADHGEEIFDRGWLGHTRTLYDELLRVPLLLHAPGIPPRVVPGPVSLAAVTPTLLELLGSKSGAGAEFDHRSLVPLLRGESGDVDPVFAEVDFMPVAPRPGQLPRRTRARKRAVIEGSYKLIHDELAGRFELYQLEADPGERDDLSAREPERVAAMRDLLDTRLGPPGPQQEGEAASFTPAQTEELRALGYGD